MTECSQLLCSSVIQLLEGYIRNVKVRNTNSWVSTRACKHMYVQICMSLMYPIYDTTADVNKQMFWKLRRRCRTYTICGKTASFHSQGSYTVHKGTRTPLWGITASVWGSRGNPTLPFHCERPAQWISSSPCPGGLLEGSPTRGAHQVAQRHYQVVRSEEINRPELISYFST